MTENEAGLDWIRADDAILPRNVASLLFTVRHACRGIPPGNRRGGRAEGPGLKPLMVSRQSTYASRSPLYLPVLRQPRRMNIPNSGERELPEIAARWNRNRPREYAIYMEMQLVYTRSGSFLVANKLVMAALWEPAFILISLCVIHIRSLPTRSSCQSLQHMRCSSPISVANPHENCSSI